MRKLYRGLSTQEKQELKDDIYRQLNLEPVLLPKTRSIWNRALSYAAAAALIFIISGLLLFQNKQQPSPQSVYIAKTGENETRQLSLPDGSVVILNASSSLQYRVNTDNRSREVVLTGNGFFKVKKDIMLPRFLVHAHDITVSVVGTQFNVNARTPKVEVALTSGKVHVDWMAGNGEPALMVQGDLLKTDPENHQFSSSKIDTLLYSAWTSGQWHFRNTSLAEMSSLMQEYYGASIVFKNEKNKNLKMTGVLPVSGLHDLVTVIKETLQVPIIENGNQLFIQ
jgi:transmembrane sensor